MPGSLFYSSEKDYTTIRLDFALYPPDVITEGIQRCLWDNEPVKGVHLLIVVTTSVVLSLSHIGRPRWRCFVPGSSLGFRETLLSFPPLSPADNPRKPLDKVR